MWAMGFEGKANSWRNCGESHEDCLQFRDTPKRFQGQYKLLMISKKKKKQIKTLKHSL